MTVVSSSNTITFAGDGVQNNFDFNFRIFKAEDLCAVVRDSEGREERLVAGSDFKIISGLGADSGGRVQYPVSGEPLPIGKSITLYREIPYTQELELVDNDPFSAQLLNEVFDRGVMRDQQLQEQLDRALKYEISTPGEDRLSTKEMMQAITNARDDAVSARSGAIEAEGNTRGLLVDAQAARGGAEAAQDKAETARTIAEDARDSAIKIAAGDISALRSSVPVLLAQAEAPEGTTVLIVISDHVEDGVTSYEINTLGFGTASISGNTISWTLENINVDILKSIEVVRRRRGELYSDTAAHQLLVKHISVQHGPTMVFADSSVGYPGATVDVDGVHAPAHSVAADNINQVVSAKPEIVQTSGKLSLLVGTSENVLKLNKNYTGPVVTDQGEGEIATCVEVEDGESSIDKSQVLDIFGDGSCLSLYTFNDTLLDAGPYDRFNLPQEANCFVTGKFGKGYNVPSATPKIMPVGGTNMVPVDGARTVSFWAKFASASAISARIWNLQGGSDASTYTTDIGGIYSPAAGKVQAILNSGGFNSPQFDDPGDWFLMTFESSPDTGGKIYVNNTLLMEGIAHVEAKYAYRLYQATSTQGLVDQARIFNRVLTAEERAILLTETVPGYKATLAQPLPGVPTKAVKKPLVDLKIGAGADGESLGPEKTLTLKVSDLIPTMTAATTDGVSMSATPEDNTRPGYRAGDKQAGVDHTAAIAFSGSPVQLTVVFPASKSVNSYKVQVGNQGTFMASRAPKDWTLQGRPSGGAWVNIHTVTDQTGWVEDEERSFKLGSVVNYDEYQIHITADNGGDGWIAIAGFALLSTGDSTASSIIVTSNESIKDQILKTDGLHKKILVDGVEVEVESVSERAVSSKGNLIPNMTGPTTSGCTVTGDSEYQTGYGWKAGDHGVLDEAHSYVSSMPTPKLTFVFDKSVRPTSYRLGMPVTTNTFPTAWTIEGRVSGGTWVVLDTKTGQSLTAQAYSAEWNLSNVADYDEIRVNVSAYGGGSTVQIAELELFADVTEVEATINLKTPLANAPTADTVVTIPDRCTLAPVSYTYALDGDDLKITGAEIALEDNPALKRLAMAVSGEGVTFKGGKMYIKEKP